MYDGKVTSLNSNGIQQQTSKIIGKPMIETVVVLIGLATPC